MLKKICATAAEISSEITLVVGYQKESIINESEKYGFNISYSIQEKALGTGDAVKCGMQNYQGASKVLILYGDVPLIKQKTLEDLINKASDGFSILTTHLKDPYGKWPSLTVRTLFPGPQNDGEIALWYNYPNTRRVKVMTRCDGSQIETWIEE